MKTLKEATRSGGDTAMAARPRTLLSLEEVRESGRPAFFSDHGEHLLYQDGELFDLGDGDATWQAGSHPQPLPRQILVDGVGIEYGWRHSAGCACHFCAKPQQTETPSDSEGEGAGVAVA